MRDILRDGLSKLGLDEARSADLEAFARLVLERNRVMNLTAITDETEFARLHLLDSAALLKLVKLDGKSVIDVGTGAGFPGVPLRILCPLARMTLLDATAKRVDFLREACQTLGLDGVECVHARAEELAAQRRESFDYATSRAVAALPVLCELCLPFVRVGGSMLAMKSTQSDEELDAAQHAIALLGGRVARVEDYTVPTSEVTHRLIVIDKVKPTPPKYPRTFGQIKKKPL
ncbi:MAG: 16S rRNA (guanine(527)-N(7))-methyltransferase RsmG [Ruminococcaceae bacterium]|jgi:16S rRNA (guanine527-N7)-methyltransferase|nr:16S rRNA (guanine(527)-N(7))-methyltransferase RsmG [Oscillospiraceae bacterium]